MRYNWTCPHCNLTQVVTEDNLHQFSAGLEVTPLDTGDVGVEILAIGCLNTNCKKLTLDVSLCRWLDRPGDTLSSATKSWRLVPESSAIPQPDYIPDPITESYYEACRIRDLSAKASATLSRRCLQGMIRDFCKIKKGTLNAEIKELRTQVDQGKAPPGVTLESVEAIDQVRSIGNIGAHMEQDINLIVDVDPGEAQALIELIELLFDEWYVARHQRQKKLAHIEAIAAEKKAKIAEAKAEQAHEKEQE
jgi:hypothetical protein